MLMLKKKSRRPESEKSFLSWREVFGNGFALLLISAFMLMFSIHNLLIYVDFEGIHKSAVFGANVFLLRLLFCVSVFYIIVLLFYFIFPAIISNQGLYQDFILLHKRDKKAASRKYDEFFVFPLAVFILVFFIGLFVFGTPGKASYYFVLQVIGVFISYYLYCRLLFGRFDFDKGFIYLAYFVGLIFASMFALGITLILLNGSDKSLEECICWCVLAVLLVVVQFRVLISFDLKKLVQFIKKRKDICWIFVIFAYCFLFQISFVKVVVYRITRESLKLIGARSEKNVVFSLDARCKSSKLIDISDINYKNEELLITEPVKNIFSLSDAYYVKKIKTTAKGKELIEGKPYEIKKDLVVYKEYVDANSLNKKDL